jgi:hypothetical protein
MNPLLNPTEKQLVEWASKFPTLMEAVTTNGTINMKSLKIIYRHTCINYNNRTAINSLTAAIDNLNKILQQNSCIYIVPNPITHTPTTSKPTATSKPTTSKPTATSKPANSSKSNIIEIRSSRSRSRSRSRSNSPVRNLPK